MFKFLKKLFGYSESETKIKVEKPKVEKVYIGNASITEFYPFRGEIMKLEIAIYADTQDGETIRIYASHPNKGTIEFSVEAYEYHGKLIRI